MTESIDTTTAPPPAAGERADLLAALGGARYFLQHTARDLTDDQAALTPSASELCIGGLFKHMARGERQWAAFMSGDSSHLVGGDDEAGYVEHASSFRMLPGETLADLLADYGTACAATDEIVARIDLDSSNPLPPAPWFEPGARWSARRVVLHLVAETAQHAGHADIVRETIDGAKSMG